MAGSVGPYALLCELGSGGMGKVYLAKRSYTAGVQRIVALKVQRPEFAVHPRSKEMFLEEARIASRIVHPYVCAVNDVGIVGDACYVVMDYIVGEPLSRVMERLAGECSETSVACLLRVVAQLCEGLHAVHEARDEEGVALNVVHRDVAPDNLFVLYDGTVRVADFGVACTEVNRSSGRAGSLAGKLAYMSPEQMRGQQVDRRSDIWSMCVVIWELLTGHTLFRHLPDMVVVAHALTREIEPPSHYNPAIPPEIDRVVLRGLSRDPHERYANARDLGRDLDRVLNQGELGVVDAARVGNWLEELFPGGREFRFRLVARAKELLDSERRKHGKKLTPSDPVDHALSRLSMPQEPVDDAITFVFEPEEGELRATPVHRHDDQGGESTVHRRVRGARPVPEAAEAEKPAPDRTPDRPWQRWLLGAVGAAVLVLSSVFFTRLSMDSSSTPTVAAERAHAAAPVSAPQAHPAVAEAVSPDALPTSPEVAPAGDALAVARDEKRRDRAAPASGKEPPAAAGPRGAQALTGEAYVAVSPNREAYVLHQGKAIRLPYKLALPPGDNTLQVRLGTSGPVVSAHVRVMPGYLRMVVVPVPGATQVTQ